MKEAFLAYRSRSSPHHDRLERWQTLAARGAGLFLLIFMAAVAFLFADTAVPRQHLPWTPLRLADPIGAATRPKVSQAQACRNVLAQGGVTVQSVPDSASGDYCRVQDAVFINGGAAALKPSGAVMTCEEALAYALWERQVVQPAALEMFGARVASIDHYGTYACRRRYGKSDAPVSEHAFANALDVASFRLTDGRVISVQNDWTVPGLKSVFLHRVRDGACRVFSTTLSPDYNQPHWSHLHLDMGRGHNCG